jgi:WD40 repeat protein
MTNVISAVMQKARLVLVAISTALTLSALGFPVAVDAGSEIEITTASTEHTVVIPFEKSFRFIVTIKNNGTTAEVIVPKCGQGIPPDWHLLTPAGQYQLAPGQAIDYVAIFEPNITPQSKEETVNVPFSFSWDGGSKQFEVTVKTKILSDSDLQNEDVKATISVLDKSNNTPVPDAFVVATLPSSLESYWARPGEDGYELILPSGDYLGKLANEYMIDHTSIGYYLQIYAEGYKAYFESDYLPRADDSKTIKLESLNQVGEYKEHNTIESGYSIWWIKASADGKFIAFSQGAHGQPGIEPPDQTKVVLTDGNGELLWERQTGGECWGLDISPDGQYVATGCHDGNIYLWDKDGEEVWKHNSAEGRDGELRVRWVKFSPDGNYLLSGPVAMNPGDVGLFEVNSGKLLWSFGTGDWLREARFSVDGKTAYLSSTNGTVYAVDAATGKSKWLGSGGHAVPFLLGINEQIGVAVSSGKGRAFTALDLTDGSRKWQTVVDQTVTAAGMAGDGSIVGATVGGMAYGVNPDGSFKWMRKYGGVGHNGVHHTSSGDYALLGGPNPTLFDSNGNVLWQREKDKPVAMTGPAEQDTGGANAVWVSEDASLIVLGGDDGKITFYKGSVKAGDNNYSQLSGMDIGGYEVSPAPSLTSTPKPAPTPTPALTHTPESVPAPTPTPTPTPTQTPEPELEPAPSVATSPFSWPLAGGMIGGVIAVGLVIMFLVRRKAH